MSTEITLSGTWLACYSHAGIRVICEAETRFEAERGCLELIGQRLEKLK
jgi:hypothetical protein